MIRIFFAVAGACRKKICTQKREEIWTNLSLSIASKPPELNSLSYLITYTFLLDSFFVGLGPFSLKVVFSSPSFMASYSRILRLADWHHFVQLMLGKRASSSNRGKLCANQRNQLFCRWMLPAPHRGHRGVGLLRHGNSANVRKPRVQGSDTGGQIHTSVRRRTRRGLCARGRNQVSFAWNFLRGR